MSHCPWCMQFWRVSAKCGWQGWMRHLGTNSLKRCRWMLTVSLNPTSYDVDGKRRRLELWTTSSSQRSFGHLCRGRSEPRSGPRQGPCPPCRSLPCPRTVTHGLTPSPSACSFCADFTFPSLCPHASADVAVHSILVATIGPRVLWQAFLGEGVSRQRVPLPGFAARWVRGSAPMSWTWIFCLPPWMAEEWKLFTTLVAVQKRDGTPRTGADRTNGVALASARLRKERTYPELSGEGREGGGTGQLLVVLAAEVGGRWATEARDFLVAVAAAKAREAPFLHESSVTAAWLFRWSCMLAALRLVHTPCRWWVVWPQAWTALCRHCVMFCLRRGTCEVLPVAFFPWTD